MRQIIIARKDLNMSPGKLAAQVSHASMAFLNALIKEGTSIRINKEYDIIPATDKNRELIMYRNPELYRLAKEAAEDGFPFFYIHYTNPGNPYDFEKATKEDLQFHASTSFTMESDVYQDWFCGLETKTVCEAKNRNQLLKAKELAEGLNMKEGKDFFLIKDACLTELEPEETDEKGNGWVLTCIGFRPLPDSVAHMISKKFQLYK